MAPISGRVKELYHSSRTALQLSSLFTHGYREQTRTAADRRATTTAVGARVRAPPHGPARTRLHRSRGRAPDRPAMARTRRPSPVRAGRAQPHEQTGAQLPTR